MMVRKTIYIFIRLHYFIICSTLQYQVLSQSDNKIILFHKSSRVTIASTYVGIVV